jgi:hypothetical protein
MRFRSKGCFRFAIVLFVLRVAAVAMLRPCRGWADIRAVGRQPERHGRPRLCPEHLVAVEYGVLRSGIARLTRRQKGNLLRRTVQPPTGISINRSDLTQSDDLNRTRGKCSLSLHHSFINIAIVIHTGDTSSSIVKVARLGRNASNLQVHHALLAVGVFSLVRLCRISSCDDWALLLPWREDDPGSVLQTLTDTDILPHLNR